MLHPFGRSLNFNSQPCKLSRIWVSKCHSGSWWTLRGCEHWHQQHRGAALIGSRSIWICIRRDRRHRHFFFFLSAFVGLYLQACDLCLPSQTVRRIWFRRIVKTNQTGTTAFSKKILSFRAILSNCARSSHLMRGLVKKPKHSHPAADLTRVQLQQSDFQMQLLVERGDLLSYYYMRVLKHAVRWLGAGSTLDFPPTY